ncbi:MAG: TVP38/TMEM64 family protein [Anaerolineae bacterium]
MSRTQKLVLLILACAVLVALTIWLVSSGALDALGDWDAMDRLLTWLGPWSIAGLLILQAIQVLIPIIPSQLLGMASGYLYGISFGTLLSLIGTTIGSWIAIWVARRYGRPFVERHTTPETIDKIDALSLKYGAGAFFLVALFPFLPTDVGCFVAGLTPLRKAEVLVFIVLGRLPGVLVLNVLGATSTQISLETMVMVTVFTLVVAAVLFHFRDRLERAAHGLLLRIGLD